MIDKYTLAFLNVYEWTSHSMYKQTVQCKVHDFNNIFTSNSYKNKCDNAFYNFLNDS